jgi:hypothetical protein
VALEQRVHRHGDGAEGERRVVDAGEVGDVGHEHGDPVALADPLGAQGAGVGEGLLPELGVGGALGSHDHRDVVCEAGGRLGQDRGDRCGRARGGVHVRVFSVSVDE